MTEEGTGTLKLKLGARAVGTLEFADCVGVFPPSRISLIFFRSSAVRLAVPLAAKKLASWELTSPGDGRLSSCCDMLVFGVLVGMLLSRPTLLCNDCMSPKVVDERSPLPKAGCWGRY